MVYDCGNSVIEMKGPSDILLKSMTIVRHSQQQHNSIKPFYLVCCWRCHCYRCHCGQSDIPHSQPPCHDPPHNRLGLPGNPPVTKLVYCGLSILTANKAIFFIYSRKPSTKYCTFNSRRTF